MSIYVKIAAVLWTYELYAACLENGLVRTPPMGWLSWERFRCNTDCENDPDNCISERLFQTMADLIITEGYAAVGYEYINIDDCWLEKSRAPSGHLVADRKRFPNGMKFLSDYIHSRGLKFGIYEDYGNYTCAGYPGIIGYQDLDAKQFAEWNVDYVKLDGCYALPQNMDLGYSEFERLLNKTGKSMVLSCSWPVYQIYAGIQPNFSKITKHCNLWRNFDDIQDSWASVESIIDYYGNNQDIIAPNAGPGHWNDPDMLIIGNFGLSYEQAKTQFAVWSILAAPLLMSVDLRTIRQEFKEILQNRKIVAVNQDMLGIQGRRIYKHKGIEIWSRPLAPVYQSFYSYGIAFVNRRTDGTPSDVAVTLKELGLTNNYGYRVEFVVASQNLKETLCGRNVALPSTERLSSAVLDGTKYYGCRRFESMDFKTNIPDLYENVDYGVLHPATKIKVKVNPSGVVMLKADSQSGKYLTSPNALQYFT